MTREARSIFLVGITLFIYALIGLIKDGGIVFPFPLKDFFLFAIVFQYIYWHHKDKLIIATLGLSAFLGAIGHPLLWESVLPYEDYTALVHTPAFLYVKYISMFLLLVWGIIYAVRQKNMSATALSIKGIIIVSIAPFLEFSFVMYLPAIGYLLLSYSSFKTPVSKPFHLVWYLLLMFEVMKLLSFG